MESLLALPADKLTLLMIRKPKHFPKIDKPKAWTNLILFHWNQDFISVMWRKCEKCVPDHWWCSHIKKHVYEMWVEHSVEVVLNIKGNSKYLNKDHFLRHHQKCLKHCCHHHHLIKGLIHTITSFPMSWLIPRIDTGEPKALIFRTNFLFWVKNTTFISTLLLQ